MGNHCQGVCTHHYYDICTEGEGVTQNLTKGIEDVWILVPSY